ncbi:hypothetical protein GOODEAATRI_034190, partial [Goodea atripinnis]
VNHTRALKPPLLKLCACAVPRFRNDGEVTSRSRWIRTKQNTHCRPHRTERVRPDSVHGVRGEGRRTPQPKTKRRDTELSSVQNLDLNRVLSP